MRRKLLTLQRKKRQQGDFNSDSDEWENVIDIYTGFKKSKGAEVLEGDQQRGQVTREIEFRWSSEVRDITSKDRFRLVEDDRERIFEIISVVNRGEANRWMDAVCLEQTS